MKNKITVTKGENSKLHFYLQSGAGRYYLFSQPYTKGVYEFFRLGRSENEVRSYRKWNQNPRLDKDIERMPLYIEYVLRMEIGKMDVL